MQNMQVAATKTIIYLSPSHRVLDIDVELSTVDLEAWHILLEIKWKSLFVEHTFLFINHVVYIFVA